MYNCRFCNEIAPKQRQVLLVMKPPRLDHFNKFAQIAVNAITIII